MFHLFSDDLLHLILSILDDNARLKLSLCNKKLLQSVYNYEVNRLGIFNSNKQAAILYRLAVRITEVNAFYKSQDYIIRALLKWLEGPDRLEEHVAIVFTILAYLKPLTPDQWLFKENALQKLPVCLIRSLNATLINKNKVLKALLDHFCTPMSLEELIANYNSADFKFCVSSLGIEPQTLKNFAKVKDINIESWLQKIDWIYTSPQTNNLLNNIAPLLPKQIECLLLLFTRNTVKDHLGTEKEKKLTFPKCLSSTQALYAIRFLWENRNLAKHLTVYRVHKYNSQTIQKLKTAIVSNNPIKCEVAIRNFTRQLNSTMGEICTTIIPAVWSSLISQLDFTDAMLCTSILIEAMEDEELGIQFATFEAIPILTRKLHEDIEDKNHILESYIALINKYADGSIKGIIPRRTTLWERIYHGKYGHIQKEILNSIEGNHCKYSLEVVENVYESKIINENTQRQMISLINSYNRLVSDKNELNIKYSQEFLKVTIRFLKGKVIVPGYRKYLFPALAKLIYFSDRSSALFIMPWLLGVLDHEMVAKNITDFKDISTNTGPLNYGEFMTIIHPLICENRPESICFIDEIIKHLNKIQVNRLWESFYSSFLSQNLGLQNDYMSLYLVVYLSPYFNEEKKILLLSSILSVIRNHVAKDSSMYGIVEYISLLSYADTLSILPQLIMYRNFLISMTDKSLWKASVERLTLFYQKRLDANTPPLIINEKVLRCFFRPPHQKETTRNSEFNALQFNSFHNAMLYLHNVVIRHKNLEVSPCHAVHFLISKYLDITQDGLHREMAVSILEIESIKSLTLKHKKNTVLHLLEALGKLYSNAPSKAWRLLFYLISISHLPQYSFLFVSEPGKHLGDLFSKMAFHLELSLSKLIKFLPELISLNHPHSNYLILAAIIHNSSKNKPVQKSFDLIEEFVTLNSSALPLISLKSIILDLRESDLIKLFTMQPKKYSCQWQFFNYRYVTPGEKICEILDKQITSMTKNLMVQHPL